MKIKKVIALSIENATNENYLDLINDELQRLQKTHIVHQFIGLSAIDDKTELIILVEELD